MKRLNISYLQEVAEKAMVKVNEKIRHNNLYKLVKVIKARTQVVSGMKYYLTILAAPTTCRKASFIYLNIVQIEFYKYKV